MKRLFRVVKTSECRYHTLAFFVSCDLTAVVLAADSATRPETFQAFLQGGKLRPVSVKPDAKESDARGLIHAKGSHRFFERPDFDHEHDAPAGYGLARSPFAFRYFVASSETEEGKPLFGIGPSMGEARSLRCQTRT